MSTLVVNPYEKMLGPTSFDQCNAPSWAPTAIKANEFGKGIQAKNEEIDSVAINPDYARLQNEIAAIDEMTERLEKLESGTLEELIWAVAQIATALFQMSQWFNLAHSHAVRDANEHHVKEVAAAYRDKTSMALSLASAAGHATSAVGILAPTSTFSVADKVAGGSNYLAGMRDAATGAFKPERWAHAVSKVASSASGVADQLNTVQRNRDQATQAEENNALQHTQQRQQDSTREKEMLRQKIQGLVDQIRQMQQALSQAKRDVMGR